MVPAGDPARRESPGCRSVCLLSWITAPLLDSGLKSHCDCRLDPIYMKFLGKAKLWNQKVELGLSGAVNKD